MAINPETQYPGKIAAATAAYPYGAARNVTNPSDGTGTPWEAACINDVFGFFQAMLKAADIVPTGDPETAQASQYLDSLRKLLPPTPVGGIIMYDGLEADLPSNWLLCNGQPGTPDLRDRFIVGTGPTYALGATGGDITKTTSTNGSHSHGGATGSAGAHAHGNTFSVNAHTLNTGQIPAHNHVAGTPEYYTSDFENGYTTGATKSRPTAGQYNTNKYGYSRNTGSSYSHTHGLSGGVSSAGAHTHTISADGGHAHTVDVRPPYYALAFIKRVA